MANSNVSSNLTSQDTETYKIISYKANHEPQWKKLSLNLWLASWTINNTVYYDLGESNSSVYGWKVPE